jgi:hypothetical protein
VAKPHSQEEERKKRGRAMTGEEILKEINRLLDMSLKWDFIHVMDLKPQFFKLFLQAYRNDPRLTGPAISDAFFAAGWMGGADYSERKPKLLDDESAHDNSKFETLNRILRMWDEWLYALTEVGYVIEPE